MRIAVVFLCSLMMICCKSGSESGQIYSIEGEAQGTTYHIKYIAGTDADIKADVEQILDDIDDSMSTYKSNSIISRVNAGDSLVVVDEYFKTVFNASKEVWQDSKGAFDPTVATMVNIWGFGPDGKRNELDSAQVDSALQYVGFEKLKLSPKGTVVKKYPNINITFNANAQGYTVDVISDHLLKQGIENYIVEVGGEMIVHGKNTVEDKDWVIGIDDPLQKEGERTLIAKVKLNNKGLATSGNYRKVIVDPVSGQKYVHTIDPATGYPKRSNVLSATVVSSSCMTADAYATTFMVMDLDSTKEFLLSRTDLDAMILYVDENHELQRFMTEGFSKMIVN